MRFNGICLISPDVRRLRDFYREVLQVEADGESTFVLFDVQGAMFSIFSTEGTEKMAPGSTENAGYGSHTVEFEVENIEKEYERLTNLNVPIVKPLTTQSWGRQSFWFRDPDGNIVNFYTEVEASE